MVKDKLLEDYDLLTKTLMDNGLAINADVLVRLEQVRETIIRRDLSDDMPTWIRVVHRLGRQLQSYLCLAAGFYLVMHDKPITLETALFMGGTSMAYAIAKGKGFQS